MIIYIDNEKLSVVEKDNKIYCSLFNIYSICNIPNSTSYLDIDFFNDKLLIKVDTPRPTWYFNLNEIYNNTKLTSQKGIDFLTKLIESIKIQLAYKKNRMKNYIKINNSELCYFRNNNNLYISVVDFCNIFSLNYKTFSDYCFSKNIRKFIKINNVNHLMFDAIKLSKLNNLKYSRIINKLIIEIQKLDKSKIKELSNNKKIKMLDEYIKSNYKDIEINKIIKCNNLESLIYNIKVDDKNISIKIKKK